MFSIIDKLEKERFLSDDEFKLLIENTDKTVDEYLYEKADNIRRKVYSNKVYIRGLIEISNFCKNDCYYCGIRCSNKKADRYRLNKDDILQCANQGYQLGFRTFVLQGGEDAYYTDDVLCDIIKTLKEKYPDCAVTLSLGERQKDSYQKLFNAGADRYLLRHETADSEHYSKLHPEKLSLKNRMECLYNLKQIGFQTGCGFMVGSPYQTTKQIIEDLKFIKEFEPQMCGIGPFIPHKDTPFKDFKQGSLDLTLRLLSIVRLMLPNVLLPATTALGTIDKSGREKGIKAGANVVMPNLSPISVRKKYMLYDNKISTGDEAAESKANLEKSMKNIGYEIEISRGDFLSKEI
ncbi:MAG: [FeFe] hydrogenase H-cluster radical SAM maturase HydE [Acutalibacteraceae bacterium]|nr:[FeFe] hydrogenase H-cluster radical SAM maturase HydE [Acutalibacteraceae bacterium]